MVMVKLLACRARGPGFVTLISEIPSHDVTERLLKQIKSSNQPNHVGLQKNFNLGHNFWTSIDGAFILHVYLF